MLFLDVERDTTIKLLVVDNDRNLVEMLTGWLKTLGYEVHRAYTGKQAMREWGEHQPDLIILDPLLNDVDALAMCREMRSEHDALVIVLTDGKDVHDEIRWREGKEAPADDDRHLVPLERCGDPRHLLRVPSRHQLLQM